MCFRKIRKRTSEAEEALLMAKHSLNEVKKRDKEVKDISEASKEFRRRNHFSADLQSLFEGEDR